jgi:hypothetical protein
VIGQPEIGSMETTMNSIMRRIIPPSLYAQLSALTGNFYTQTKTQKFKRIQCAYGLLMASETAKRYGFKSIAVAEFGVFQGRGLRLMASMAEKLSKHSGVDITVHGFDIGIGLPPPKDHRDLPHIFNEGQYRMDAQDSLTAELQGRAELHICDVADIENLSDVLDPEIPLGFAAVDVDYYSSTIATFNLLNTAGSLALLPSVNLYIHDSYDRLHYHRFTGQLLAIEDFNRQSRERKIDIDRFVSHWYGNTEPWHASMYAMHTLDYGSNLPRS